MAVLSRKEGKKGRKKRKEKKEGKKGRKKRKEKKEGKEVRQGRNAGERQARQEGRK
jgi:hypothetical protein